MSGMPDNEPRLDCTCPAHCPACVQWAETHRRPRRRGSGPGNHCTVHGRYQAGCVACQRANHAYHAGRQNVSGLDNRR